MAELYDLSCNILGAGISVELQEQRVACVGDTGDLLTLRWGQSLTYLELQWDGYHGAKCIRAKYTEEWRRNGAAPMHLKGTQQEGKLCTPLSLRRRGLQGLQSSAEMGL